MYRTYYVATEDYAYDITIQDDLTTVSIIDFATGNRAKAHALRFHQDAYQEQIGTNIAYNRALERLARKNEKYFIRQTQPVR